MIKNIKRFLFVLLAFIPTTVFSVDLESIDGIWQHEIRKNDYYSIHQDGNTIVMINLRVLGFYDNTLAATYVGSKDDFLLTPLAPISPDNPFNPDSSLDQIPVILTFISDNEVKISIQCDVCAGIPGNLIKVFK